MTEHDRDTGDTDVSAPNDDRPTERQTMKDVSHVPPHSSDGVIRVFERGGEQGRGESDDPGATADEEDDEDDATDDEGHRTDADDDDADDGGSAAVDAPAHE